MKEVMTSSSKMFSKEQILLLTLFLISWVVAQECQLEVYVDREFNNNTCTEPSPGKVKCGSLTDALKNPNYTRNSCVYITSDMALNEAINIDSAFNLSVISNGTMIYCTQGSSVSFNESQNINISGLDFMNCGNALQLEWSYREPMTHAVNVAAAISFIKTENVRITNTKFQSSRGYSLLFDNSDRIFVTQTIVTNSNHVQMNYQGKNYSIGGGIFIHWQQSNSKQISITDSEFNDSQNRYFKEIVEPIDNLPYEKGTGIAIFFGEGVQNNIVHVENVQVSNNTGGMGTGLYIHFADDCVRNSVVAVSVNILDNKAKNYGAGVFVHHDSNNENNKVLFENSKFHWNEANVGGAVCLVYFNVDDEDEKMQSFLFKSTDMLGNKARVGAAIHSQNVILHLHDISVSFSSSRVNDNALGQGSIYAMRSTLNFTGNFNTIKHNNNSAVVLDSSEMLAGGTIAMYNNIGYNGGAIAFYEHSKIYLSHETHISFEGNIATNKGGAIYVLTPGPALLPFNTTELNIYSCFVQFIRSSSKTFSGKVIFLDNTCTDNGQCDIFVSSLQSCALPTDTNRSQIISHWKNFIFYGNMTTSITTNAVSLHPLNSQEWISFPGDLLHPHIILRDERENDVGESIIVAIKPQNRAGIKTNPAFVVDKDESIRITLLKKKTRVEKHVFDINVKTTSDVFLQDVLKNITFKPCLFGYNLRGSESCECDVLNNEDYGIAVCDSDNIYLDRNRWVDPLESNSHICPVGYCFNNPDERFNLYVKDRQCSGDRNQSSRLCSRCKDDLSVSSGHSECLRCDHGSKGWLIVSLVTILGLSLFIGIVMLLDIDIMSYNLNICLYSYQIIDLLYTDEQTIDVFLSFIMSIFQFTESSSRVYPSYCMWGGMNDLHKVAFGYLIPAWMSIFMAILYILVRNKRNWMHRWFKTMSIVLMMCFSDFIRVSFELLHFTKINGKFYLYRYAEVEYFKGEHLPYAIVAIIVLFVISLFSIAQMILLLRADVDLFEWLRKFEDNICNYFKKDKRWFWIFYFACRVEIYAIGIFLPNSRKLQLALLSLSCLIIAAIFSFKSPFKDDCINRVETFVLGTLAIISVMSIGIRNIISNDDQMFFVAWIHVLSYIPFLAVILTICTHVFKKMSKTRLHFRSVRRASNVYHPVRVFESYDSHQYQRIEDD